MLNASRCGTIIFAAFTLLHISDLHVDVNEGAMKRLEQLLPGLEYDLCEITGTIAARHLNHLLMRLRA
jgi:hypothetical protein